MGLSWISWSSVLQSSHEIDVGEHIMYGAYELSITISIRLLPLIAAQRRTVEWASYIKVLRPVHTKVFVAAWIHIVRLRWALIS